MSKIDRLIEETFKMMKTEIHNENPVGLPWA